jgi:photosystem II stability/assembly factor-like uncharacterized protein
MVGPLALGALLWVIGDRAVSPVPLCVADDRSAILVYAVAVDPTNADRIVVAAAGDTVYRSTGRDDCVIRSDAGLVAPSGLFPRPVNPYRFAIDLGNPDRIYVGTTLGLYASFDGGRTWELVFLPPVVIGEAPITSLAIDPARPNIVYAGGNDGAYKTSDYGASWTTIDDGFIGPRNNSPGTAAFAIDPHDTDTVYLAAIRVYKTLDGGALWARMDAGISPPYVWNVAVDWSDPDVVYAGTADGIYRSTNAAASWQSSGLAGRAVYSIRLDPSDPSILFAGTDLGAFRSEDGGHHWSPLAAPFSGAVVQELAIAPSVPATIYAATAIGVFRSRDGGTTWKAVGIDHRVTRVIWTRPTAP